MGIETVQLMAHRVRRNPRAYRRFLSCQDQGMVESFNGHLKGSFLEPPPAGPRV